MSVIAIASSKCSGLFPDNFAPAVSLPVFMTFAISCIVIFCLAISARRSGNIMFADGICCFTSSLSLIRALSDCTIIKSLIARFVNSILQKNLAMREKRVIMQMWGG